MEVKVHIDVSGIAGSQRVLDDPSARERVFLQWAKRYSAFIKRRFLVKSGGGDIWPDLAESTKIARAKKKQARGRKSAKSKAAAKRKAAVKREIKKTRTKIRKLKKKLRVTKSAIKKQARAEKKAKRDVRRLTKRVSRDRKKNPRTLKGKTRKVKVKIEAKLAKVRAMKAKIQQKRLKSKVKSLGAAIRKAKKKLPQLNKEVRKQKKQEVASRKFAILRDLGLMFRALDVGASGNTTETTEVSVIFGFGEAPHGDDDVTLRDLAGFHDAGDEKKNRPPRVIFEYPDDETIKGMLGDVARAVLRGNKG